MNTCMMCSKEFNQDYRSQKLCKECLDKFTKRHWDWNEYRKQGHTRRPTCIVCDKPLTSGFSVCPDCREAWKHIYYEITRPKTLIQARKRMARNRHQQPGLETQLQPTKLDDDITAARKAGMSYGIYMARKKGLVR